MPIFAAMLIAFSVVTVLLGIYGYRNTKDNNEFLLGRNKTNPIIIGLSYGATFLSASAVIGFGGQSAVHGLSLMWLCFLNLFVGLFVAFLVFGPRTRKIGKRLGASTFADLLGKMYKSKGIRGFTAILIIVMMPIYCAAVLKGGVNSVAVITGLTEYYDAILLILSVIVGIYVVYGGIIAVMYNDALQAVIMFVGMVVILCVTATQLGGLTHGFEQLSDLFIPYDLTNTRPAGTLPGFNGWTEFASFGSSEWMLVFTTFIMGVGLGVLTQPQLIVRFMSAKDDRMLNRSLIVGSVFMLVIVGTAYTCGALSNVYFFNHGEGIAATHVALGTDFIVPTYIQEIFSGMFGGDFFVCLFLLSLVCASISTISALMHTIGAAGGYDLYTIIENKKKQREEDSKSVKVNRAVTAVMMVLVVVYCYVMPNDIIAKATSLFMGMTAAALLPAFCHGLYTKGTPDKRAALASISVGTASYLFWALFINKSSCVFLPICKWITNQVVLFPDSPMALCDSLMIALPLSIVVFIVVHLLSRTSSSNADGTVA
ncbi:MAG: sodium:solute symporter family protein [archaeon]|nr:sodium:solute symporter family protein [archaeon]